MNASADFSAPSDGFVPFPELAAEQAHLDHSRACRDRMVERLESVDPDASADEITKDYIEMTVAEALFDLRGPGAGDFFGRIDVAERSGTERFYVGRRHIEDDVHDPVVIDWRAPMAAAFYRATAADPLDVSLRRRFTLDSPAPDSLPELTAYLDEHLDDPDAADVAGGIPDPVLAEIGAERTGAMREIVATIQAEQDVVIRAPIDQVLVVQGGPGTGKTAVALHRAAFLMFEHRRRLSRDGVLVVGPNRAFLDYISHVLPSLGERAVRQCTVFDLCLPKVDITGVDDAPTAALKGSVTMLGELERAAMRAVGVGNLRGDGEVLVPLGSRQLRFSRDEVADWVRRASDAVIPINERRVRLRSIMQQELRRRAGGDDVWSKAPTMRSLLTTLWPTQQPMKLVDGVLAERFGGARGKKRAWTLADQLLVDEANSMLNGPPQTYGHVVVDEAQDHSAVALRAIGRRSRASLGGASAVSMTLVGDVAQSTTPAGQERWADLFEFLAAGSSVDQHTIAELTIGYRVPEPILREANLLLPLTGVDAAPSRSVRLEGRAPWTASGPLGSTTVLVVAEVKHRHRLTGVVAPLDRHHEVSTALADAGFRTVDHLHELASDEVPLFGPEQVKGLEFDGVVVVAPDEINDGTPRGARLLYVAMTRAVQELAFVAG